MYRRSARSSCAVAAFRRNASTAVESSGAGVSADDVAAVRPRISREAAMSCVLSAAPSMACGGAQNSVSPSAYRVRSNGVDSIAITFPFHVSRASPLAPRRNHRRAPLSTTTSKMLCARAHSAFTRLAFAPNALIASRGSVSSTSASARRVVLWRTHASRNDSADRVASAYGAGGGLGARSVGRLEAENSAPFLRRSLSSAACHQADVCNICTAFSCVASNNHRPALASAFEMPSVSRPLCISLKYSSKCPYSASSAAHSTSSSCFSLLDLASLTPASCGLAPPSSCSSKSSPLSSPRLPSSSETMFAAHKA
mmetsp:Transcript_3370/g.9279  ORF Transcript_3370/g.9279 Transcript_3370/m.9279 type:complete len:312 (-) Transcript_3370:19-954(-)